MTRLGFAARGFAISALLIALTACSSDQLNPAVQQASQGTTVGTDSGEAFSLYTHCGIDELGLDGKFYERVGGPLDDGNGNPPNGWGNPYQPARLSREGNLMIFTDRAGHLEEFKLRRDATQFKHMCA